MTNKIDFILTVVQLQKFLSSNKGLVILENQIQAKPVDLFLIYAVHKLTIRLSHDQS